MTRFRSPRTSFCALALLALVSLAACGGAGGTAPVNPPPPPPAQLALTAVRNFVAGDTALISGTMLGSLASLTVDGQAVPFTTVSDTVVRVTLPSSVARTCDVDGRMIEVKATASAGVTAAKSFPLTVSATQNLAVGQSVVLSAADLGCLRLPAGNAAYVLSALDLARSDVTTYFSTFDTLGTLTMASAGGAITSGASASAARMIPLAHGANDDRASIADAFARLAALRTAGGVSSRLTPRALTLAPGGTRAAHAGGYVESSNNPAIDPGLLTANVGDQFTMIDWRQAWGSPTFCTDPLSSLPRLPVTVVAISGKTVILADARLANIATYTSAAGLAYWKSVADTTEASYLPAVRSVISATYTPLQSANGRTFVLITDLSVGSGGRGEAGTIAPATVIPETRCQNSPEIELVLLAASPAIGSSATGDASVIVHERTHIADAVLGNAAPSGGARAWMVEALAVSAEETAARIRAGVTHQAPMNSGLPYTTPIPNVERYSTWGLVKSDPSTFALGMYQPGMQILLRAREKVGQADPLNPGTGPTLYERMLALPRSNPYAGWTVDELASLVGMNGDDLLDETVSAALTDDAVPALTNVPQFDSWKGPGLETRLATAYSEPTHLMGRGVGRTQLVATGAGSYDYWYIGGTYSQPTLGASFTFQPSSNAPPMRIRLTRLQ